MSETESKHMPGEWFAERRDWRGEPSEHKIYISGNRQECYDEDDDPEDPPTIVATAICIVEGNATSQEVTEANARRIVQCVNAHDDLLAACRECLAVVTECYEATGHIRAAKTSEQRLRIEAAIAKAEGGAS